MVNNGVLRILLLILLVFALNNRLISSSMKHLYSPDKTVYAECISTQSGTILKFSISNIVFYANVGITINGRLHVFNNPEVKLRSRNPELAIYSLKSKKNPVELEVALLNNALAYRYVSKKRKAYTVASENSSFTLAEGAKVWYFERSNNYKLKSYAGLWQSCQLAQLPTISGKNAIQGAPLLFQYPDNKIAVVTEVNLQNYSGARWDCSAPNTVKVNFTEGERGFAVNSALCSPWRVLFVSNTLSELVNQKVIRLLSSEPDPKLYAETSYIVPGKCVWRWFSKGTGTPAQEREFVDYAARLDFKYTMVDEGWEKWKDYWQEVKKLTIYGKSQNIGVFLWKHSHTISDPKNDYIQMRLWLDSVKQAGVTGVKVDFMDSESENWIDFDIKLLKECAKRRLLVNFHGCQKPTGEQFTYPNEITREGIRGLELNKHPEGSIPAFHNALLPFTRLVLGSGDYTPLSFVNPGNTTLAHQLATFIAFNSRLQVMAEDPEIILNNPIVNSCVDLIKAIPVIWDETVVLSQTSLGELTVVARRKGESWFIYALNGTEQAKKFSLDLTNIISAKMSKTTLFVDDLNDKKVLIEGKNHRVGPLKQDFVIPFQKTEKPFSTCEKICLAPNGGAVIWIQ